METSGIKVKEIMTGEVVIVRPDMTITEVARLMNSFRIGGLPVIEHGKLIGMLTERDIMSRVVATNQKASEMTVSQVMTSPPKVVGNLDEDIKSIAGKISRYDVTRIPIVDKENRLVGIVTNKDVLRNSHELLDVLMEQARVKGQLTDDESHTAFGKCELCGQSAHLQFINSSFVCDACTKTAKKKHKIFGKLFMF
ncbi:MAG: CBS domain-containing protein [archaeon]